MEGEMMDGWMMGGRRDDEWNVDGRMGGRRDDGWLEE